MRHSADLLKKEQESAEKILGVTEEREKENLELPVAVTKDQLTKARVVQRILQLEGRQDELEVFLRSQTGLAETAAIEVTAEELPGAAEQEGALAAIYFYGAEQAKAGGQTLLSIGGTRPCAKDGVFAFKRKWGIRFEPKPDARLNLLVRWREPGAFAEEFLTHSPLFFRDGDDLSLVAAAPDTLPERARALFWSEGMKRMYDSFVSIKDYLAAPSPASHD